MSGPIFTPVLRTAFSGSIRNGFPRAWQMATRDYGTYRARMTPVWERPSTIEQGLKIVDQEFAAMKKAGFFKSDKALKILMSPEGKLNGKSGSGGTRSGAAWPVKAEVERATIARLAELMRLEPPGSLYMMVNYVDCQQTKPDGKRIGETRGVVVESGTGDIVVFGKKLASDVDGWDYDEWSVQEKDGPKYLRVKDTSGDGRDVAVRLAICKDIALLPPVDPFPPHLLLVSGSGIPPIDPTGVSTDLVLVDQKQVAENEPRGFEDALADEIPAIFSGVRKTLYEAPNWPSLKLLDNLGLTQMSSVVKSGLQYFGGVDPATFDATTLKVKIERARAIEVDGVKFLDLPERAIPGVGPDTPARIEQAIEKGATVVDEPVGEVVEPDPRSPEEQLLEDLAADLRRSPNPDWPTPEDPQSPSEDPVEEPEEPFDPDEKPLDAAKR